MSGTERIGRFRVALEMSGMFPRIEQHCRISNLVYDERLDRYEVFATSDHFDLVDVGSEPPLYDCCSDGLSIWFKRVYPIDTPINTLFRVQCSDSETGP